MINYKGRSGGLMMFWKTLLDITRQSYSQGHIDCQVQHLNKKWRFTGFYRNPDSNSRNQSWELLRGLKVTNEPNESPWLVGGDFNEICYDREKIGGNPRPLHQTRACREVLQIAIYKICMGEANSSPG